MKFRKTLTAILAIIMVLSMVSCGSKEASAFPGTPDEDMVTLDIVSEPIDINPIMLSDIVSQSVLSHVMAGLTKLNASDEPVKDIAESWEISKDNTEYVMHLRKDAKWSNGDPVKAQDFYFSWVTQMTKSTGTPYAAFLYQNIKNGEDFYNGKIKAADLGLEVIDDYTLRIEWSRPMPNGLFWLSQSFFLPMNEKAYSQIGAKKYAKEADQMVTNGAYKITEWVHNDHITMEKFDGYYDASKIAIPKVKLVMIGDANTRINAFTAGELDMCSLYSEQISQIKEKDDTVLGLYNDGGSYYLNFNMKDENLSNVNLRKALAMSVDIQSLLDNVIADGSIAADGFVPDTIAGVDGKTYSELRGSLFKFDPDAAKKYFEKALKELGKDKTELKLELWGTDTTYEKNQLEYLQQQWKTNLGLEVKLKSTSVKALDEGQQNGEYQFTVGGWGPSENDAITYLEAFASDNLNNYGKYSNEEYDKLIEASFKETDVAKRQQLLVDAEKILMEDMAIGPMYFTSTTFAVSHKVTGIIRTPFQYFNVREAKIEA